jgi:hypothetical protein
MAFFSLDGQHTGALPGGLIRNQYVWQDGVKGVQNLDAVFADPVRDEILANVAAPFNIGPG